MYLWMNIQDQTVGEVIWANMIHVREIVVEDISAYLVWSYPSITVRKASGLIAYDDGSEEAGEG